MAIDYNSVAHQNLNDQAAKAAQAAYNDGMLAYNNERLALEKAQQAWKETMDKAGLTGQYEGQWTMPVQQWQAQTFGTWGAPTAGQQTLSAQQQAWQQAYNQAMAYGQYYAPGQTPQAGQQTLAAQNQWWSQNLQAQQEARAAQAQQQAQAQQYLDMMTKLRGPADYWKYQEVLGATPGGYRDLVAAAMGQYIPGGGATTGQSPQAATLQALQQQIGGVGPQQVAQQQAAQGGGANQQFNALGGGTNTMGQPQPQTPGNLPAPNQIAPQAWKNLAPSQQQMLMGAYEAQGWNKDDVGALFAQSLPKYATNAPGAGTWRLAA